MPQMGNLPVFFAVGPKPKFGHYLFSDISGKIIPFLLVFCVLVGFNLV